MSIYRPRQSRFWHYDFRTGGRRFSGSTGETEKRAAERVEARRRLEARALEPDARGRMTLANAAARFIAEVAAFQRSRETTGYLLADVVLGLGEDLYLDEITPARLAGFVAAERGRIGRHGRLISNATVNRQLAKLRTLINRAGQVWHVRVPAPPLRWRTLMLEEAQERVRALTPDEESRLMAALPEDYRAVVAFALATGLRRENVVGLTWAEVDLAAGVIETRIKSARPGRKLHRLPLGRAALAILSTRAGHDETRVFTYAAARTTKGARKGEARRKGMRYPVTVAGLRAALTRAAAAAGLRDFTFHDTRHTAATRLLQATGNLRLAQRALGHSSIATTARYAAVLDDDLRAGFDAASGFGCKSPEQSPEAEAADPAKPAARRHKSA